MSTEKRKLTRAERKLIEAAIARANQTDKKQLSAQDILGKPVLVMRDTTERPEALVSGTVHLVGTDYDKIMNEVSILLDDTEVYEKMSKAINPYGDGNACHRITDILAGKETNYYDK